MEADELTARLLHVEHELAVARAEAIYERPALRKIDAELVALWWGVAITLVLVYVLARRITRIERETEVVDE